MLKLSTRHLHHKSETEFVYLEMRGCKLEARSWRLEAQYVLSNPQSSVNRILKLLLQMLKPSTRNLHHKSETEFVYLEMRGCKLEARSWMLEAQ
ncbi:hypothetical protein JOE44_002040 [Chryseobacterium sp. PvR013]|uniref:hypothetical protein n=1 Tax=Chryseobacterium sp. PvR013 TaxID=2806595 RepID=UPI001AE3E0E6|nr:hypothetical protein [Chryseobacterium sp. PvR013]MBP1165156.1 hypothetical protein [Chryseobacterium sp. PvR013]